MLISSQFLVNLSIPGPKMLKQNQLALPHCNTVRDRASIQKHHLFVYKRSMLDENLKGLAQKLGLPRPWQVQN